MKRFRYKVNGYWHEADEIQLPDNTEAIELIDIPHEHLLFTNVDGDYQCKECHKLFGKSE